MENATEKEMDVSIFDGIEMFVLILPINAGRDFVVSVFYCSLYFHLILIGVFISRLFCFVEYSVGTPPDFSDCYCENDTCIVKVQSKENATADDAENTCKDRASVV